MKSVPYEALNKEQVSILRSLADRIKPLLAVKQAEDGTNFTQFSGKFENEEFAKYFTEALLQYTLQFYVEGKTKEIKNNIIVNARIAMGGVAHKPWRLTESENFLKGKTANSSNFEDAARIAMHGAKGFGENDFKLKMAPNAIIEALTVAKGKA